MIKAKDVIGIVFCVAVATAPAMAAENILLTRPGFEVGAQVSSYHYEEPAFAKTTGHRQGVDGAFTFRTRETWYGKADVRYSYGKLRYEGSGTKDSVPDTLFEARFVEGKDFLPGAKIGLSPYGGFGYRYLYDDIRGTTSTGAVGYRRYSNYLYIPLGLTMRAGFGEGGVIVPTIEYDLFLHGRQKSKLSDTGLGYSDADNNQDKGYGYRASLMFEHGHFAFGPWMNYWKIKDSDTVAIGGGFYGMEPANWTREIGFEVKYKF